MNIEQRRKLFFIDIRKKKNLKYFKKNRIEQQKRSVTSSLNQEILLHFQSTKGKPNRLLIIQNWSFKPTRFRSLSISNFRKAPGGCLPQFGSARATHICRPGRLPPRLPDASDQRRTLLLLFRGFGRVSAQPDQ